MTDGADLLAAILANPEDDNVRLVYADFLQEHGDAARAEFIRVQCAIARMPGEDQCPKCYADHFGRAHANGPCRCAPNLKALRRREYELWQGDLPTGSWNLPGPDKVGKWGWYATPRRNTQTCLPLAILERGFVCEVRLSAAAWLTHADAILAAHPVRRVKLTTTPDLVSFLARGGQKRGFVGPIDREWWLRALADEWRGVTFELPP